MTLAEAAWQHYADQQRRTRCATTDLPASECGCHQHRYHRPLVITAAHLERLAGRKLPEVRYLVREREWRVPEPKTVRCTHRRDDLCGDCSTLLTAYLADLPMVIEQLEGALRKAYRIAPHGFRRGDTETPDEAPVPWNPSAVRCLSDVHRFMLDAPLKDRHWILENLSGLARRAHRIIDRPVDREITMCPTCRAEIVVTNRSLAVTCGAKVVEDDPDAPKPEEGQQPAQRIRICDYAASWEQHRKDLLSVNLDAMLTMNELLIVLGGAGEQINRDKINNLIRRHGLPREEIVTGQWRQGEVKTRSLWVYRLGDVMFLMAQIEERKAG
mgnify:FL=1